jgi:GH15 family glucan-1,4-alpha-glucosidase
VLWELWRPAERYPYYAAFARLYEQMVHPAPELWMYYRLEDGTLPRESYDLWEERYGIYTFTTAAVIAGLEAAARFAERFGTAADAARFAQGAAALRVGLTDKLYDAERGHFLRGLTLEHGAIPPDGPRPDATLDSSVLAVMSLGVLPADDPRVVATARAIEQRLWVQTAVGGIVRYEGDLFRYAGNGEPGVPGNPWFICTLWLAEWYIRSATQLDDLKRGRELLAWCLRHSFPSGVLTEQLHPHTGQAAHVSPLTWSHAAYVHAVDCYARRYRELSEGARKKAARKAKSRV